LTPAGLWTIDQHVHPPHFVRHDALIYYFKIPIAIPEQLKLEGNTQTGQGGSLFC
jgi:hypothetical protein